jgi:hypothetical protein
VTIAVAAAAVIAVALAIGSLPAALLGLALLVVGGYRAWGWLREGLRER